MAASSDCAPLMSVANPVCVPSVSIPQSELDALRKENLALKQQLQQSVCGVSVLSEMPLDGSDADSKQMRRVGKYIQDPVHGHVYLEPELIQIIDTPQFQRLRDLKQLGTCYFVFPGASHHRFEHSIGTCVLAGMMLRHLQQNQPELQITNREILLVKVAALCHDLGHGPFSHVFDNEFIPAVDPNSQWRHERASVMMLNHLIKENHLPFTNDELSWLHELINPSDIARTQTQKTFLYDIVANARNSVDVDKFDYLSRDAHNLGMKISWHHERMLRSARVIDDEICFSDKDCYTIYEMFHSRYSLFKQVYSHRVAKSVEYMVTDVLLLADKALGISSSIYDPHKYLHMTDCLLKQIEISTDPELCAARALVDRIRRRDLYKMVDEVIIPSNLSSVFPFVTEQDIVGCSSGGLCVDDIKVHNLKMNYALKDKNPVDNVHFYNKSDPNVKFKIPRHKVSCIIPEHFQETYIRVYVKHTTQHKLACARMSMHKFLSSHNCMSPQSQYQQNMLSTTPNTSLHSTQYSHTLSATHSNTQTNSPLNSTLHTPYSYSHSHSHSHSHSDAPSHSDTPLNPSSSVVSSTSSYSALLPLAKQYLSRKPRYDNPSPCPTPEKPYPHRDYATLNNNTLALNLAHSLNNTPAIHNNSNNNSFNGSNTHPLTHILSGSASASNAASTPAVFTPPRPKKTHKILFDSTQTHCSPDKHVSADDDDDPSADHAFPTADPSQTKKPRTQE